MKFYKNKVVVTLIVFGVVIFTVSLFMFLKILRLEKEINLVSSIALNSSGSTGAMIDDNTFVGVANYGDDISILFKNDDDETWYTLRYTKNGSEEFEAKYTLESIMYNNVERILNVETNYVSYIDLILGESKDYDIGDLKSLFEDN